MGAMAEIKTISEQLLPLLGAIALIFLCVLLKKLWKTIDSATAAVERLSPTMNKVDTTLDKVQAPLDTAVKVSKTMDAMSEKTTAVVNKGLDFVSDNMDDMKDYFQSRMKVKDRDGGTVDTYADAEADQEPAEQTGSAADAQDTEQEGDLSHE